MTLAHAICPKLKPWLDDGSQPPHPCRQCDLVDTSYGKSIPMCLSVAQEIAAAVVAHLTSDEAIERAARALKFAKIIVRADQTKERTSLMPAFEKPTDAELQEARAAITSIVGAEARAEGGE